MALKLGDQDHIVCPICDGDNVHIIGFAKIDSHDNYEAAGDWVRGDVHAVKMECENGDHTFDIQFGFHKGWTRIRAVPSQTGAW